MEAKGSRARIHCQVECICIPTLKWKTVFKPKHVNVSNYKPHVRWGQMNLEESEQFKWIKQMPMNATDVNAHVRLTLITEKRYNKSTRNRSKSRVVIQAQMKLHRLYLYLSLEMAQMNLIRCTSCAKTRVKKKALCQWLITSSSASRTKKTHATATKTLCIKWTETKYWKSV